MTFLEPGYLYGLIFLVPLWILWARSRAPIGRLRFWILGSMRSLVVAAFALALALPVSRKSDAPGRRLVVPLVDASVSIPKKEQARVATILRESLAKPRGEGPLEVSPLVFGHRPVPLEGLPWEFRSLLDDRTLQENWQDTRVGQALLDGVSRVRGGDAACLVLFSDGNSSDDVGAAIRMLQRASIPVHVVPLETFEEEGYRVVGLESPRQVFDGDRFEMRAAIESNRAGTVRVIFRSSGKLLAESEAELVHGQNFVTHSMEATDPGLLQLEVEVEPISIEDQFKETNRSQSITRVVEVPKTLVVSENPGGEHPLVLSLESMGIRAETITPDKFPGTAKGLNRFSAVVFDDVPASAFKPENFQALETFVKDTGGGFLMAGKQKSFGPGGYRDTRIEEILPVNLPTAGFSASSAVVLVLDISGSMAGEKFDASKAASKVLMRQLKDRMVSIVTFSDLAAVWMPMRLIGDEFDEIDRVIDGIPLGGGTMYSPAIDGALQVLDQLGVENRYIVMLSDGAPADYWALPQIMGEVINRKTQLSTIAIGAADISILEEMANQGGGRFYHPDSLEQLSDAFKEESTFIVKGEPMVKSPAAPVLDVSHPILKGFKPDAFPVIQEYVGTSLKERGELVLSSPSGDPVLAVWRYGLGQSAVYTTDSGGAGNKDWLTWPEYPKFWSQVLKGIFRTRTSDFTLRAEIVGDQGTVAVDAIDVEGHYLNFLELKARIERPSTPGRPNEVIEVPLLQTNAGRYEVHFPALVQGFYAVTVTKPGEGESTAVGGATKGNSTELSGRPKNLALLSELAHETGGSLILSSSDIQQILEKLRPMPREKLSPLWPWFAAVGMVLLFLEICARRLGLFNQKLQPVGGGEGAREVTQARHLVSMAKDLEASGEKSKAQAYYLKAHSLLLKGGAEEEARRAWERYRLLDGQR